MSAGRWMPAAAHDEAYARAAGTIEQLVSSGAVDRFVVEDRIGTVLFDRSYFGARDDELAVAGRQAAGALDHAWAVEQMTDVAVIAPGSAPGRCIPHQAPASPTPVL